MRDIEDEKHNTTRFVVLADTADNATAGDGPIVTTFIFRVRNVPAALYKAMGGFATNGVNMTKLESYQIDGRFVATVFYADVEGHPDDPPVARALEELSFFCTEPQGTRRLQGKPLSGRGQEAGRVGLISPCRSSRRCDW